MQEAVQRRPRVAFASLVRVVLIPSCTEMKVEERARQWYSSSQLAGFRADCVRYSLEERKRRLQLPEIRQTQAFMVAAPPPSGISHTPRRARHEIAGACRTPPVSGRPVIRALIA